MVTIPANKGSLDSAMVTIPTMWQKPVAVPGEKGGVCRIYVGARTRNLKKEEGGQSFQILGQQQSAGSWASGGSLKASKDITCDV